MQELSDVETGAALNAMQSARLEKRYLVIGGTGNVGKHTVHALVKGLASAEEEQEESAVVRVLVGTRSPETFWASYRHPPRCPVLLEPTQCDATDPASLAAAIAAAGLGAASCCVFYCLPQQLTPDAMVASGEAIVDASVAAGVQRLVRVSSLGVQTQGALGAAHRATGAYCQTRGLPVSSVCPTSFHINFEKYDLPSICAEDCFRSPLGTDARVNWVHCGDIGRVAAALMLQREEGRAAVEVVDVTGPPESTLSAPEMAALLSGQLGRTIRYEEVEPPPMVEYQELWGFLRSGGFDCSHGADTVHELTGTPPISFREIVLSMKDHLESKH